MQEPWGHFQFAGLQFRFVGKLEQILGELHDDFAPLGIELMSEFEQPSVVVREVWRA